MFGARLGPILRMPTLLYLAGVPGAWNPGSRSKLTRAAGIVYPPLVILTIVVTGNHFVLDAVAGIAVMGAGFLTVNWWRSRNRESNSRVCAA